MNKIPDICGLVNKTDYDIKISEIDKKYFTTSDYNKFTKNILDAKMKQKRFADKSNIYSIVKNYDLNKKLD